MIAAFIPARGGSKGIPKKNIKKINGKPLIYWSIISALESKKVDKIILSTDDDEIIEICKSLNLEVLIDNRPKLLATDNAKTIDVLNEFASRNPQFDSYVVLQPTSPLRQKGIIDKCLSIFYGSKYNLLASGFWTHIVEYGSHENARRQDLNEFFYDDGNLYILSKNLILKKKWFDKNHFKYENIFPYSLEIDTIEEFKTLEILMKNKNEL